MMQFESKTIGAKVEILNRDGYEGVPVTLDFTAVTETENGRKIVKAGTQFYGRTPHCTIQ